MNAKKNANPAQVLKEYCNDILFDELAEQIRNWLETGIIGWTSSELKNLSIKAWQTQQEEEGNAFVKSGYGTLIYYLAQYLNILCNQTVQQVKYTQKTVIVTTENAEYQADKVIITLPLGVLKSKKCQFIPDLPKENI